MSTEVEQAAGGLGVQLRVLDVKTPDELDGAFAVMKRERADALLLPGSREMAAAGFLVTYGQNQLHEFRRAAVYVDRILKGANPADLPVEQPTSYVLAVNLKTPQGAGRDDSARGAGTGG
jgi:ABC transporter substrate binding protein